MDTDPAIVRFLSDGEPRSDARRRNDIAERLARDYGPGLGYWSVFASQEPDRFFGWICLRPLLGYPDIEIGYCLAPAARGQGYATEAGHICLDYGFGVLGLSEIVAVVDPANERSQNVITRLGFSQDGERLAYDRQLLFYRLQRPALAS